jgi:hypothetical protein
MIPIKKTKSHQVWEHILDLDKEEGMKYMWYNFFLPLLLTDNIIPIYVLDKLQ